MTNLSSQHHSFDIQLATRFGIQEAILIHHFQHWIRVNRAAKRNIKDGRCWSYQTRKDIQAHFPYWSYEEVKYLCEKLVKMGVFVTGNYNKSPMDRTLWYAFEDEKLFAVDEEFSNNLYEKGKVPNGWGKVPNALGKSPSAIPDTKPYTKPKDEGGGDTPKPPPTLFFIKEKVKMEQRDYDKLILDFGEDLVTDYIERLILWSKTDPKKFNAKQCHSSVIRSWLKKDGIKPGVQPKKQEREVYSTDVSSKAVNDRHPDAAWLDKGISSKLLIDGMVYIGCDFIEFLTIPEAKFKFGEAGFREKVSNSLRKLQDGSFSKLVAQIQDLE